MEKDARDDTMTYWRYTQRKIAGMTRAVKVRRVAGREQIRLQPDSKYVQFRTIKLPHHKGYIDLGITRKRGPKGGTAQAGPVHKYKARKRR